MEVVADVADVADVVEVVAVFLVPSRIRMESPIVGGSGDL